MHGRICTCNQHTSGKQWSGYFILTISWTNWWDLVLFSDTRVYLKELFSDSFLFRLLHNSKRHYSCGLIRLIIKRKTCFMRSRSHSWHEGPDQGLYHFNTNVCIRLIFANEYWFFSCIWNVVDEILLIWLSFDFQTLNCYVISL